MKLPPHEAAAFIKHNEHKNYYQPIEEFVAEEHGHWSSDEAKARAIATNEIWIIQWYPITPIGFCVVCAPTLQEALDFANSK